MNDMNVVSIGTEAIKTALLVASPMLAAGMAIGLIISVLQVATSIQDITITFVPKIVAVLLALLLSMHWTLQLLSSFTRQIFDLVTNAGL